MSVNPPRPNLPPLNALRAFEAAARLEGFKQAAEELNVTPGAVAQHVKLLEETCGAALFERQAKGVRLTELGRTVLPEFIAAFDAMSRASEHLRAQAAPNRINLATLPGIAQLLMAEWLPRIRAVLPHVQVSVTAMEKPPNLLREAFDFALFFESPLAEGDVLFGPDQLLPVCTADLAARLRSAEDLMDFPHISDQFWPDDWRRWFENTHPGIAYQGRGPTHSLYSIAVAEARAGAGILMGHLSLVHPLLASRELVPAWPGRVNCDMYLVLHRSQNRPKARDLNSFEVVLRDLASEIGTIA